jgi:hypothetical protein
MRLCPARSKSAAFPVDLPETDLRLPVGAHLLDCSPGAGKELIGPPAEQERVGALVGLGDQRPGLVVTRPFGPSAPLESVPAVLIRRGAVSLVGGLSTLLRTPRPRSDTAHVRAGADELWDQVDREEFSAPTAMAAMASLVMAHARVRQRRPSLLISLLRR